MAKTLQQVLGGENLTGVINSAAGGVPDDLLPPGLQAATRTVDGDVGTYYKVENTRKTARQKAYGSKAEERGHEQVVEQPMKLIHAVEMQRHKPDTLMNLRSTNGGKQILGEQEVSRQVVEFKRLFTNLRLGAIYSTLANGKIWFDADGELLPSASGTSVTVDWSVPAGNQNQLDALGAGAIIDAS